MGLSKNGLPPEKQNTRLCVIPTITWQDVSLDIYCISSDNLFDSLSDIYSGNLSDILSDIYSGNLSDIYSGILSDIYSDSVSDIYSDILSDTYLT